MADTGAPWNIPYVAGSDLVRDWPTDSQELAVAIANGLDAAGNAGIGSNVVQAVKTDTFTTTSSTVLDVTGLTVTISPTSATSKLFVTWYVTVGTSGTGGHFLYLTDGSNVILTQGDAAGSRTRATNGSERMSTTLEAHVWSGSYLWSPASTSPQTAKIRVNTFGGLNINRTADDTDNAGRPRTVSSLNVIEVAA